MRFTAFTAEYAGTGTQLDLLRESCATMHVPLITYGAGKSWPGWLEGKTRDGLEFIRSVQHKYDLLMWVDGFDSLVLRPDYVIANRWLAQDSLCGRQRKTVIVATERNCWPDADLAGRYPAKSKCEPGPRYINAGGYIGPPQYLIETLEAVLAAGPDGGNNDQHSWHLAYLADALPHVDLDQMALFRCMSDPNDDPRLPAVAHWNGATPGREEYWKKFCAGE